MRNTIPQTHKLRRPILLLLLSIIDLCLLAEPHIFSFGNEKAQPKTFFSFGVKPVQNRCIKVVKSAATSAASSDTI